MNAESSDNIITILKNLERCRNAKPQPKIFGAETHEFILNPPLDLAVVSEFERLHKMILPEEYRRFIAEIGNGGAGPGYGVFKLGEIDDSFDHGKWNESDGFVGVLSEPFPHTHAWNDLPPYPEDQEDEDAYEAALDQYEEAYWNTKNVNGAIPICHHGCAIRSWLVVTGKEAGNVWLDHRADEEGLRPSSNQFKIRLNFLEWYDDWLQHAVSLL